MSEDRSIPESLDQSAARRLFRKTAAVPTAAPAVPGPAPGRAVTPEGSAVGRRLDYSQIKGDLLARLLDDIGERGLLGAGEAVIGEAVREFVDGLESESLPLNESEIGRLAEELMEEAIGLGPLAPLMADPAVTDVLVNGPELVYVERFGRLERTNVRFRDASHVERVIERIASRVGRRIDQASPMVDLRLTDGSRVNATLSPASVDYPTLSIRRFGRRRFRRSDLVRFGTLSPAMLEFMEHVIVGRKNVLISGGTGAGKSTLLGALCEVIPAGERVITIEDTVELSLDQEHVVRLESRPPNVEGTGTITARDLVINCLRMRPDRIIMGEVRGAEALDMLQAMNTGHDGGLTTIHANSPRDALSRLETMVLMAGMNLPSRAIREQMISALDFLVHIERHEDGVRRVSTITEITGLEENTPLLQDVFHFQRRGRKGSRVVGEHEATGIVPRVVEELRARGVDVDRTLFEKPQEV